MKTIRSSIKTGVLALLLASGLFLSATPSQAHGVPGDWNHHGYYDNYHRFHNYVYWHRHCGFWRNDGVFIIVD